jgi:hypothetical protein
MSTLKVNSVQHNTSGFNSLVQFADSGGTQNGTLCRTWVNFDGSGTVSIRADFNVNTITDIGTGQYTVNFTNAMPDANFATVVGGQIQSSGDPYVIGFGAHSTTSVGVTRQRANGSLTDGSEFGVAIFH